MLLVSVHVYSQKISNPTLRIRERQISQDGLAKFNNNAGFMAILSNPGGTDILRLNG